MPSALNNERWPAGRARRDLTERGPTQAKIEQLRRTPASWRRVGVLTVVIVGWFAANLVTNATRLLNFAPDLHLAAEAAASFARLFGALVLFLVADERPRLRWIAASFLLLGLAGLAFGYVPTVFLDGVTANTAMYLSRCVWTIAGALILIGVAPRTPATLRPRHLVLVVGVPIVLLGLVVALSDHLPALVHADALDLEVARNGLILGGMTRWHWLISTVPFLLAVAAVIAAATRDRGDVLGGRLFIALVFFAGAQLHDLFWPSAYGPVLTASDVLELLFAGAVAVAGVVELHRVATERTALLAHERARAHSLRELAELKSDFTAMIAHELANPLAAIRRQADLAARGHLDSDTRDAALGAIQAEAKLMTQLVLDVQESARIERADFDVAPRPYPVEALLADAAAYARTLPGHHPVTVAGAVGRVRADPERIGQVLRNLLENAAAYSPNAAPIAIRAVQLGASVRIEIQDTGGGIPASDLARIFDKFERGGGRGLVAGPGLGLGLYVARRIVAAHGSELRVHSIMGEGSTFGFDLEVPG